MNLMKTFTMCSVIPIRKRELKTPLGPIANVDQFKYLGVDISMEWIKPSPSFVHKDQEQVFGHSTGIMQAIRRQERKYNKQLTNSYAIGYFLYQSVSRVVLGVWTVKEAMQLWTKIVKHNSIYHHRFRKDVLQTFCSDNNWVEFWWNSLLGILNHKLFVPSRELIKLNQLWRVITRSAINPLE